MSEDIWAMQRIERGRLVDYLRTVPDPAWEQPSLCPDYRVRDVVAHLIAGAKSTPPRFLADLVGARFDFHKAMATALARYADGTAAQLVARLEAVKDAKARPKTTLLGEIIVHGEDIRRPVGSGPGDYDLSHLRVVADHYTKAGGPLGAKKRIAGLRLQATDTDWAHGDGPVVTGPMLSVLLAMAGRTAAHAELDGPGLAALADRG